MDTVTIITGQTGSGKTTCQLELINELPENSQIIYITPNLEDFVYNALRSKFGGGVIFYSRVADNIEYGLDTFIKMANERVIDYTKGLIQTHLHLAVDDFDKIKNIDLNPRIIEKLDQVLCFIRKYNCSFSATASNFNNHYQKDWYKIINLDNVKKINKSDRSVEEASKLHKEEKLKELLLYALTNDEKAYIFDILNLIENMMEDPDVINYCDYETVEQITSKDVTELSKVLNKLHKLGWSKHRKHDAVTGLPIE